MYRLSKLNSLGKKIFHTQDLAIIWGISNRNTLYTSIKRYTKRGDLIRIYKGLYSIVPLENLNPIELGGSIAHRYAYLSTESVLAQSGIIYQNVYKYTFVSDFSKQVTIGNISFLFRKMQDKFLYNPSGIINENGLFIASPERAYLDMLYFNPKYHFDSLDNLDQEKIKRIKEEVKFE